MNLIDVLNLYAMMNDSDDLTLMLQDYTLDRRLDREVMNRVIIRELGAMRPFVNDTKVFKFSLENFFNKWSYNIGKLIDTMYYEYDPISNKDMNKTVLETEHRESSADIDNTDSYTTNTDNVESGTNEGQVSAYDVSTYQPKDKTINNNRIDNDVTHSGETTSDIQSDVDTEKNVTENVKGKDGDSSYQELIEQERELAQFNIFEWIIKQMRRELFLLVY